MDTLLLSVSTGSEATSDTQDMGRSILANQFVSGLQSELKSMLACNEGGFEQLLTVSRFEEAKFRDLRSARHSHPSGSLRSSNHNGGAATRTSGDSGQLQTQPQLRDTSTPTATSAAKRATEHVILCIADGVIKKLQGRTSTTQENSVCSSYSG